MSPETKRIVSLVSLCVFAVFKTHGQFELPQEFRIISKDQSGFSGYLDQGDLFGIALANLGDFDGDGVTDILVGSSSLSDGGSFTGAIWILLMNTDNSVKDQFKISNTSGGLGGVIPVDARFGYSVTSIGDLDLDGTIDLAVGAVYDGDGGYQHGAVWILFMNPNGTVKSYQKINEVSGGLTAQIPDLGSFGSSLASIGDIDGDGITELAVGAYRDNGLASKTGALYILFLKPNGTVKRTIKISGGISGFPNVLNFEDYFGCSVASIGDTDGDGISEIAVGNQRNDDGGIDTGAIWVLSLDADGWVTKSKKISQGHSNFNYGLSNGELFGTSISVLKNVDDQASVGFIVGSTRENSGGADAGAVWVFKTTNEFEVLTASKLSFSQGVSNVDIKPGSRFGQSVLAYERGQGRYNFGIGAPYYDVGGTDIGAVWMLGLGECIEPQPNAGSGQTICYGDDLYLEASQSGNDSGYWSSNNSSVLFESPNNPHTQVYEVPVGQTTFVWTAENSCGQVEDEVIIEVIARPSSAFAGEDFDTCDEEGKAFLHATTPEIGIGSWQVLVGSGIIANKNAPDSEVTNLSAGVNTLVWTTQNGICPNSLDTVNVFYLPPPLAEAGVKQTICEGEDLFLEAILPEVGSGYWSSVNPSVLIVNPVSLKTQVYQIPLGETTFVWTVENDCGQAQDEVVVEVIPNPSSAYAGRDFDTCDMKKEAVLQASAPGVGVGTWQVLVGGGVVVDYNAPDSKVIDLSEGINTFVWTISNRDCTVSSDSVNVMYERQIDYTLDVMPNAFTPNGDGINDKLELISESGMEGNFLEIFSRDGKKVYEAINYQNNWDGGNLSAGIYYFVVYFERCSGSANKGFFHLVR